MNCYEVESEMYEAMSSPSDSDDSSTTPNEEETQETNE